MANKLIRAENIKKRKKNTFRIEAPEILSTNEALAKDFELDQYDGPSVEEIKDEINRMRRALDEELDNKRKESEVEYKRIINSAEKDALDGIGNAKKKQEEIIANANAQSKKIIDEAKIEGKKSILIAEKQKASIEKKGYDKGYGEGFEKAFAEGKEELKSMLSRLEKIMAETINKRNEIIENSEKQLINITASIARKVIKGITERDQSVVLRNVSEALKKIKGKGQITIRVNLADLPIATNHKKDFYQMLDNIENVSILDDPGVDKGGCVIETDFGDVDARIETQLDEIETAIKKIQPIKNL